MSKLPEVGTTIFSIMSAKANQYNAINLSQGFPDFDIDPDLTESLVWAAKSNTHQYRPLAGSINLLEKTAEIIDYKYGRKVDVGNDLLITAGATQAIYTSITALIKKEDEVIILDPAYDCYEAPIILSGGIPVHISLNENYLPDWDKIRTHCSSRTKMLIINNPHNPSGKVWNDDDFQSLRQILADFPDLILLSDEVYEFIIFEKKHISAHSLWDFRERIIVISSYGKTFHITGWKIGYIVAPEKLMIEIKKVHQFLVFCVNSVCQEALAKYITLPKIDSLGEFYQEKRDFFQKLMAGSRFDILPSEGTYFQVLDYSKISKLNDIDFCNNLVEEFKIASIPISVFSKEKTNNHHIRICYAKKNETLEKATEILCRI